MRDKADKTVASIVSCLKEIRLEKGLSHELLAKKAGITRPAISHIESGKRRPSLLMAVKLAAALEVRLSDVLKKAEAPLNTD